VTINLFYIRPQPVGVPTLQVVVLSKENLSHRPQPVGVPTLQVVVPHKDDLLQASRLSLSTRKPLANHPRLACGIMTTRYHPARLTVPTSVSFDPGTLAQVTSMAHNLGMTRTAFILQTLRKELHKINGGPGRTLPFVIEGRRDA